MTGTRIRRAGRAWTFPNPSILHEGQALAYKDGEYAFVTQMSDHLERSERSPRRGGRGTAGVVLNADSAGRQRAGSDADAVRDLFRRPAKPEGATGSNGPMPSCPPVTPIGRRHVMCQPPAASSFRCAACEFLALRQAARPATAPPPLHPRAACEFPAPDGRRHRPGDRSVVFRPRYLHPFAWPSS